MAYMLQSNRGPCRSCSAKDESGAIAEAEESCSATGDVVTLLNGFTPIGEVTPYRTLQGGQPYTFRRY